MISKKQIVIKEILLNYYSDAHLDDIQNVIFLHGWRSDANAWMGLINNLKIDNVGIYAIDLPGFGQSQIPTKSYNLQDYSEILEEFISKLNLKNIILIGHSFGGRVSIKYAYSHKIDKLILIDSAGIRNVSVGKNLKTLVAKIVRPLFRLSFMQGWRKSIYRRIGAEDYVSTPYLKGTFVNIINEDLQPEMKAINIPTTLIWGADDQETPITMGEKIHGLISGSNLFVLQGAGHFSFIDKPKEVAEIIKGFVIKTNV